MHLFKYALKPNFEALLPLTFLLHCNLNIGLLIHYIYLTAVNIHFTNFNFKTYLLKKTRSIVIS